MNGIDVRIDRWVEAGLVSPEQGRELHRYEQEHPGPMAPKPVEPAREQPRALALVGEVVGYLGAILAGTAIAFILSRTWGSLEAPARIALVAGLLAVVGWGGVAAARATAAPAQRLATVLLAAAAGLTGWLAFVIADGALELDEHVSIRLVVGAVAAVALTVQLTRPRGASQVVALVSLAALAPALLEGPDRSADASWIGASWAALGLVWLTLAVMAPAAPRAARLTTPRGAALVVGGLLAVYGPQQAAWEEGYRLWALSTGIAVAVALVASSVARRELSLVVIPGSLGLLTMVPQLIDELVGDALATWIAVLGTGVALVLLAVWMVRGRRTPLDAHP